MQTVKPTAMSKTYLDLEFQNVLVDNSIRKFKKHRKVLMQLPTGGGKTVIFSKIIDRYLKSNPDKSVLILVHRIELLNQARNTIKDMHPDYQVDFIVQGVKYVKKCHIYIGMVESVNTRAESMELLNLGLVIIDEAHIGNFIKMHSIFTEELILGVTATPIAQSKKTPMKNYYETIVVGPSIKELIKLKRLSQNITYCPKDVVNETMLQFDAKTGDFDIRLMGLQYVKPKYVMNTFMYYGKYCRHKKTVIFNVNIEHSLEVTDCFNFAGYPCEHIDGETPMDERERKLKWFAETDGAILCNFGIVNVGFDEPTIECIILNFATLSVSKFLQACGRGGRVIKADEFGFGGKNWFTIIDLGGNSIRFGDWSDDRDWEQLFYSPPLPGKPGLAPVKTCPQCQGLVHAAVIQCKLPSLEPDAKEGDICGHIFDRRKFKEDKFLGDCIILTRGINVEEIMNSSKKFKPYFPFYEMGRLAVDNFIKKADEEKIVNITEEQKEQVFNIYFQKIKEWHKIAFPGKVFRESWHKVEARKHFMQELNESLYERNKRRELVW
jgi:superfamily II DNA or RNA helicase